MKEYFTPCALSRNLNDVLVVFYSDTYRCVQTEQVKLINTNTLLPIHLNGPALHRTWHEPWKDQVWRCPAL